MEESEKDTFKYGCTKLFAGLDIYYIEVNICEITLLQ